MAIVEYGESLGRDKDDSIDWDPMVEFAWENTKVGDVVKGVLPVKNWSTEAIAIRLNSDVVAVTSKPMSTSLVPDGSLWRTGTYAGCHINIYYKGQEEYDYVSMTVYSNPTSHYIVFMNGNPSADLLSELGDVLRQYALDHWFKDCKLTIKANKKKNPGVCKKSYKVAYE